MKLVIDHLTGEKADRKTLYKAPNGKYYTSLEGYENLLKENREREKTINSIAEFLEYPEGAKLPGVTYRKLKELEPFGYSTVFEVICENARSIEWAMQNKDFANDAGRVMYIFGIVRNNIGNKYRQKKAEANKRPGASEDYLSGEVSASRTPQKVKDISRFLEEVDD